MQRKKSQRNRLHSWGFAQLRGFVEYKAKRCGIPVAAIDPAYTSQQCPCCGVIDRASRKTQALFSCTSCGHTAAADYTAALNIAFKAARAALVTPPQVLNPGLGLGKSLGL